MTRNLTIWLTNLSLVVLFVLASLVWLDEPIALFANHTLAQWRPSVAFLQSRAVSIPLVAGIAFVALGLRSLCRYRFSKIETAALLCGISVIVTDAIKGQLKFVFGRTWPVSWQSRAMSLSPEGAYGFHFFHSGPGYESFPSGHAAATAAIVTVSLIFYPRSRPVAVACLFAVSFALVMFNYHFLSDVIAGAFLGASIGAFSVALWRSTATVKLSGLPSKAERKAD